MAHLFEMRQKLSLSMEEYKVVQTIYRGWSLLGIFQIGAVVFTLALVFSLRKEVAVFWLALTAFVCLAITLVIFFAFTYPVNTATSNWTVMPENWMQLRAQWEYSHAVNAVLELIAFVSLMLLAVNIRQKSIRF